MGLILSGERLSLVPFPSCTETNLTNHDKVASFFEPSVCFLGYLHKLSKSASCGWTRKTPEDFLHFELDFLVRMLRTLDPMGIWTSVCVAGGRAKGLQVDRRLGRG